MLFSVSYCAGASHLNSVNSVFLLVVNFLALK